MIIYTSVRLVNDTNADRTFWERSWKLNAIEITTVLFASYIFQFVVNYFARKFSRQTIKPLNAKRILAEFATVYFWVMVALNVTVTPMAALTDDGLGLNDVVIIHIVPGLYLLLYFAIVRGNNYLKQYVHQQTLLEKITNDQLQTELKFLKAQYHPHFLFNALNTIYFQMDDNIPEAKRSIEKFSELLRYQLYDQQQTVPVSQELHYLRNFIDLQKTRTSDKLQLTVCFDEALNGQKVYPLLFLPLVENAFKYVGGGYKLSIAAKEDSGRIIFSVSNSTPVEIPVKKEKGIGLENLKRRLELLYPGRHELVTEKKPGEFTAFLTIEYN